MLSCLHEICRLCLIATCSSNLLPMRHWITVSAFIFYWNPFRARTFDCVCLLFSFIFLFQFIHFYVFNFVNFLGWRAAAEVHAHLQKTAFSRKKEKHFLFFLFLFVFLILVAFVFNFCASWFGDLRAIFSGCSLASSENLFPSKMLIKEYRIPLPLTVDEYKIAQLYMIAVRLFLFHLHPI